MQVYKMEKNKLLFSAFIIYFLIFTFSIPLGHLFLLDYAIHLQYLLKVSGAIFTENISYQWHFWYANVFSHPFHNTSNTEPAYLSWYLTSL